jgi:Fe-S-cluster containining protein
MDAPFWNDGLRFECARCSACCRLEPGFVFLSATDIERLLLHSGLAFRQFIDTFIRTVDIGTGLALSLKEKANYDCILWGANGCSAYEARPVQCSTYPFWQGVIETPEDWEREAKDCPGIGKGSIVPADIIGERLWQKRANQTLIIAYDVALESIDEDTLLGRSRIIANATDTSQAPE